MVGLAAAAMSGTLFIACVTWIAGSWPDAWKSYIVQNLRYAGEHHYTFREMLRRLGEYAASAEGFYPFVLGGIVLSTLTFLPATIGKSKPLRLVAMSLVFFCASLAAVLAPGRQYQHYLLLLVAPTCLLTGSLWICCWQLADDIHRRRIFRGILLVIFAAAAIVPQVVNRASTSHPYVGHLATYPAYSRDPVAAEILRYTTPDDSLTVWGWMSRYYVFTQLRQATREAHTVYQIQWTPQIDYFRSRYLADLNRSRPAVFVDAVGPGNFVFQDRSLAHESFDALRDFVAKNYHLVSEIHGCRIYVRLDRVALR
jgi:hypothetical protein